MTNTTQIKVLEGPTISGNIASVIGAMSVVHLVRNYYIPEWNHKTKKGYQRAANEKRIDNLAGDLFNKKVDLPTSILLNRRNLTKEKLIEKEGNLYLPLPDGTHGDKFMIVDGQHRLKAFSKLIEDKDTQEKWANIQISFVCLLGANENEEMKQFYVVNKNAKSVDADLTYSILRARSLIDKKVVEDLTRKKKQWSLHAEDIKDQLAETSLWKDLIKMPNQNLRSSIINSSAMVNSLSVALSEGSIFSSMTDTKEQVETLEAFWEAVKIIYPEAFEGDITERKNYALQKTIGVIVLHAIFPTVLAKIWQKRGDHKTPEAYVDILRPALENISGENKARTTVSGVNFWVKGEEGAAGQYSSGQGRNTLIARIKEDLAE